MLFVTTNHLGSHPPSPQSAPLPLNRSVQQRRQLQLASLRKRVFSFLQDHIKISLFIILCVFINVILPLTDVFTDSLNLYDMNDSGINVSWWTAAFFLMLITFIVHRLAFLFKLCKNNNRNFNKLRQILWKQVQRQWQ